MRKSVKTASIYEKESTAWHFYTLHNIQWLLSLGNFVIFMALIFLNNQSTSDLTDVPASIYDRKAKDPPFDNNQDILRSLSLAKSFREGRSAPIWRSGNRGVKLENPNLTHYDFTRHHDPGIYCRTLLRINRKWLWNGALFKNINRVVGHIGVRVGIWAILKSASLIAEQSDRAVNLYGILVVQAVEERFPFFEPVHAWRQKGNHLAHEVQSWPGTFTKGLEKSLKFVFKNEWGWNMSVDLF